MSRFRLSRLIKFSKEYTCAGNIMLWLFSLKKNSMLATYYQNEFNSSLTTIYHSPSFALKVKTFDET